MDVKVIGVKFPGNYKEYSFNCYLNVKVGDTVVVDTANGLQVAEVTNLECNCKATKEVVDVVDMGAFNYRKERAERITALKKKMDKKVEELQDIAVYELLAEKDSELANMLAEFKGLV